MNQKQLIYAHYLAPGLNSATEDPYSNVKWVKHKVPSSKLNSNSNLDSKSKQTVDIEAPDSWSPFAVEIASSKYMKISRGETSVRQMISRVVQTIRNSGEKQGGYFSSQEEAEIFQNELAYILLKQIASFNSPVWFNCGDENPQCSACFIQSVEDNLSDIFELAKNEALIFKYGSGSGTNFSKLRAKNELLDGGGKSSGVMSFLKVLDKSAGAIRSGGIARRAAKMVILDLDHPEIEEFITWKQREEEKARALQLAGFTFDGSSSNDYGEGIYEMLSGQNSNNSVRVTSEFMSSIEANKDSKNDSNRDSNKFSMKVWNTIERRTKKVAHTYQSQFLWDKIVEAAWACGDPGIQFHDTIQDWHTCAQSGSINASNPCSEFMFLDNSACNLASINLVKFLNEKNEFQIKDFQHTIRILTIAMDIIVDMSSYPTREIKQNSHAYRPLGLGFTNLGSFFMQLGLSYGDQTSCEWASCISSIMTAEAYRTSALLASHLGVYEGFQNNKACHLKVLNKHKTCFDKIQRAASLSTMHNVTDGVWNEVLILAAKVGLRNAQVTLVAPTGTIGLLMDCDTFGIEPEYSLIKTKELFQGGTISLVNQSVAKALKVLGYSSQNIEAILSHIQTHGSVEEAPHIKEEHLAVFDCAMPSSRNQRMISSDAHLKVMVAVQPFISGAISKTVNLPNSSTISDVEHIYIEAWRLGLKSIAIYRDGSKVTQVLKQSGCDICEFNSNIEN